MILMKLILSIILLNLNIIYADSSVLTTNNRLACPSVFVIPEDPTDKDIRWVNGTNCAVGCKTPIWTDQEWRVMEFIVVLFTYIGIPIDIFVIVTWTFNKDKRKKQYFVLAFSVCSLIVQFTYFYTSVTPFEKIFCRNNAAYISPDDGLTLCNVQSFLTIYGVLGGGICWTLQSLDIYLIVVRGWKGTDQYKPLFLPNIFITPIFILIVMGMLKQYGYAEGQSFCFMIDPLLNYLFDIPIALSVAGGTVAIAAVLNKIIRHLISMRSTVGAASSKAPGSNDILKVVKNTCFFVIGFYACTFPVLTYRYYQHMYYLNDSDPSTLANMQPWIDCIFEHFDGTDASWQSICGLHPKDRMPIALEIAAISVCAHGSALLITSTYLLQPSVWKIWYKWCRIEKIKVYTSSRYVHNSSGKVLSLTVVKSIKVLPKS